MYYGMNLFEDIVNTFSGAFQLIVQNPFLVPILSVILFLTSRIQFMLGRFLFPIMGRAGQRLGFTGYALDLTENAIRGVGLLITMEYFRQVKKTM